MSAGKFEKNRRYIAMSRGTSGSGCIRDSAIIALPDLLCVFPSRSGVFKASMCFVFERFGSSPE